MKTLKQVCESIDPKLKDQLISFINSDAITDEIARKMLHMTVGGESLENLRKILSSKGIEECSRTIGFIVQDYGQLKDVLDVLNNESKQITGDDVLNSKNKNIGYNIDGWGRGNVNKADFSYNDGSIRYENAGNSAWGQFTDGYFTIGLAYTFNVGKAINNSVSYRGKSSSSRSTNKSTSARSTKVNKKASAYKKKVSKNRNKAFQKKNKKGGRIAW